MPYPLRLGQQRVAVVRNGEPVGGWRYGKNRGAEERELLHFRQDSFEGSGGFWARGKVRGEVSQIDCHVVLLA